MGLLKLRGQIYERHAISWKGCTERMGTQARKETMEEFAWQNAQELNVMF